MGKYSEYDRATMSAGWRVAVWTVAIVVFFGLLGAGIWAFKVATSEVKGKGDATIKINSGDNQIQSQELFEDLYAKIKEYDKNLDISAATLKANPSSFNQTNHQGLIMQCNAAVEEYNAATRKISKGRWMSADLPYEITGSDAATDCKETAR